jgi:hypothetical protein
MVADTDVSTRLGCGNSVNTAALKLKEEGWGEKGGGQLHKDHQGAGGTRPRTFFLKA